MARIKAAVASRKRKKRLFKAAKGNFGARKSRFKEAKRTVIKGLTYAFRDRKVKKREFRRLWIIRINAGCREAGITYSRFINGLTEAKVDVNRKVLAELAVTSPAAFKKLVKVAQEAKPAAKAKAEKPVKVEKGEKAEKAPKTEKVPKASEKE